MFLDWGKKIQSSVKSFDCQEEIKQRWVWSLPVKRVGAVAQSPAALLAPAKRNTV